MVIHNLVRLALLVRLTGRQMPSKPLSRGISEVEGRDQGRFLRLSAYRWTLDGGVGIGGAGGVTGAAGAGGGLGAVRGESVDPPCNTRGKGTARRTCRRELRPGTPS